MDFKFKISDINASHIDATSKKDYEKAIEIVQLRANNKTEKIGIEEETEIVKCIVLNILRLSREFKIDRKSVNFKDAMLHRLKSNDNFPYVWLWYKIGEVLNPTYKESELEDESFWVEEIINNPTKFIPYYQWIQSTKWKKLIYKYEALIRYIDWNNKAISPGKFMTIAKKNNLLHILSKRMIEEVINEMRLHNNNVSINLDNEIANDEIIKLIFDTLGKYNIEPSRITIEVLETISWNKDNCDIFTKILQNIELLKEKWVKISVDDYWSWNSSIERLLQINPDTVKIDRNIVEELKKTKKEFKNAKKSIGHIVQQAHSNKQKVIAEWIEDKKIWDLLTKLGVDYLQWFNYSRPSRDIVNNTDIVNDKK